MENSTKQDQRCALCSFKCSRKSQLESHIRQHTCEQPFSCDKCNVRFSSRYELKLHIQRVHTDDGKVYKCSLCNYSTCWASNLKRHQRTHTDERSFPCPHKNCGYAANSSKVLQIHNIYSHSNERKFLCEVPNCGYRGKTTIDMRRHTQKHSDFRPFVCDFEGCSYRTKTRGLLKIHKLGVHSGGYKPFACSMCNHRAASKSSLRVHEGTHLEQKSVKCTFSGCEFSCKIKAYLNAHVLNRHKEKKFKCDFAGCSSVAARRHLLEKHKKEVHYEKVLKCSDCDYRAAKPSILRKHFQVHARSRRISCPHTGCTFKTRHRGWLNKHLRYHKANLGCPLEECGYVGSSRSAWERHMQMHDTTGRRHHCPLCPKHFSTSHQFSMHLQIHTQEKPFKCPVCNFASSIKRGIILHVHKMHSNVFPKFVFDKKSNCDHCNVNFACPVGLAMHQVKLKTAVVVLTRLKLKLDL